MSYSTETSSESLDCNGNKRKHLSTSSIDSYIDYDNKMGFHAFLSKFCSILIHPIGMMLTTLLNNVPPPVMPVEFWCGFDKEKLLLKDDDNISDRDQIFAAAVMRWNGKKAISLLSTIHSYIDALCSEGKLEGYGSVDMELLVAQKVHFNTSDTTRSFLVISKASRDHMNDLKHSVVAIIDFSMNHDKWWSRHHYLLLYVSSLRATNDDKCKFIFDQPILLTIITVSKCTGDTDTDAKILPSTISENTKIDNAHTKNSDNNVISKGDKKKKATLGEFYKQNEKLIELGLGRNKIRARCGVFLCTPEGSKNYRIALLWRNEATCLRTASVQFGRVIYCTTMCAHLREQFEDMMFYDYLGPNCHRIGNLVSITTMSSRLQLR